MFKYRDDPDLAACNNKSLPRHSLTCLIHYVVAKPSSAVYLDFALVSQRRPGGSLKLRFGSVLMISLSLASCGAQNAPTRVTVQTADTFAGPIHLTPCVQSAPDPVQLDSHGNGNTAACPAADDVEIVLVKPGGTTYITRERVKIGRTGDGIAVTINANLP
jgi:hypothetical protein